MRIAASAPATFGLLPAATERFRRRNPGIRLDLTTLPAEEICERIVIGDIDLGLTMVAFDQPGIRSEIIGSAENVVLIPRRSPLAKLERIGPLDLQGQTLISYASNTQAGRALDRVFLAAGHKREPQIEITLSIAAAPLVQRGLGVALVGGLVPWDSFWKLAVRPFVPSTALDIVVGTSTVLPTSRFVREFTRDLKAAISDLEL